MSIDKQKADKTVSTHKRYAERILKVSENFPPTQEDIRNFLQEYDTGNKRTYENMIKTVRVFTRFLGIPEFGKRFDFPDIPFQPSRIHSDEEIREMYHAFERKEDQAFYLTLATSGLRHGEACGLTVEDIDFDTGMLTPESRSSEKRAFITFANIEALSVLEKIVPKKGKVFNQYKSKTHYRWEKAREKLDTHITPQDLRKWFADKMGRLGVQDRYIDAFCGRVPQSILGNHYTDFSPSKLKEVYEKADLKVLE